MSISSARMRAAACAPEKEEGVEEEEGESHLIKAHVRGQWGLQLGVPWGKCKEVYRDVCSVQLRSAPTHV